MNLDLSSCRGFLLPSEDDMKGMDEKLARDMMQLATSEREHALNDLHGVVDVEIEQESEAFNASCLEKLEEELRKIKKGTAYLQAEIQSKEYIASENFRLMFLRSERFCARESAARLIRYFDEKLALFGLEKLTKDIHLSDLDNESLKCLRTGMFQILPNKDSSGRSVLSYIKSLRPADSDQLGVRRVLWYVMSTLIEDEDIQKKGVVYIVHHINAQVQQRSLGLTICVVKILFRIMPVKKMGTHLCTDSAAVRPLTTMALSLMKPSDRVRYRCHFGSHLECMYSLRTFGILSFPADLRGIFSLDEHVRWLEEQERKEEIHATKAEGVTVVATSQVIGPIDVLFGRGAPVRDNPGNFRFRKLVDRYILQYENAERLEKGCIAYAIVVMVNESNGRFLQRNHDDGCWAEVDAAKARDKVHQTFRNVRHQK